jgi:hypothetical protein
MPELAATKSGRSPLKGKPLPVPGASVDRMIDEVANDKMVLHVMAIAFILAVTLYEWIRYWMDAPYQPVALSLAAAVVFCFCAFRIRRLRKRLHALRQGRDGERAVAQLLHRDFLPEGYRVLHDLRLENGNIDHIVIGPQGVFVIETKTWSVPIDGEPVVRFDGREIGGMGWKPDRNPVTQVQQQAMRVRDILSEKLGLKTFVHAIVTLPGWKVEQPPAGVTGSVWVLAPRDIRERIQREKDRFDDATVQSVARELCRIAQAAA